MHRLFRIYFLPFVAYCGHQDRFLRRFDGNWQALLLRGRLAIQQELERSLDDFSVKMTSPSQVEEVAAKLFFLNTSRFTVLILNNKFIVSRDFLAGGGKYIDFAVFARSAMSQRPVPNVIFQYEDSASGPKNRFDCKKKKSIPKLAIAKREGYSVCGVLCPNPFFKNISTYASILSSLKQAAEKNTYEQRDQRLFWRGHIGGADRDLTHEYCSKEIGNHARFTAASLTTKRPDLFDIRCVKCDPRNNEKNICPKLPYDSDMNWTLHHLDTIQGEYVDHIDFTKYQHFLNLPGETSGSYSRNLNTGWILGGIVFLWQNSHVEWYYPALINGVTHVSINKSNAIDMLQMVKQKKTLTARLIHGASFIQTSFLCPDCLASYFQDLITTMRRKYNFHLLFGDYNRLVNFFTTRVNCTDLQLLEFPPQKGHKRSQVHLNDLSKLSCLEPLEFAMDRLPLQTQGGPVINQITLSA